MREQGEIIGDLLLEMIPQKGVVLSKHKSVVNLLTEKGLVWSLGEGGKFDAGPLSILGPFSSRLWDLEIGEGFKVGKGGVFFPNKNFRIQFSGATPYISSYSKKEVRGDYIGRISLLKKILLEEGQWEGLKFIGEEPTFSNNEGEVSKILKEHWATGSAKPFKGLLGFGLGLTPTGDDVLTGILAVISYLDRMNCNLEVLKDKTNPLSWTSIYLAGEGRPSLCLRRVVEETMYGSEKSIVKEASILLSKGSTSGTDILYGMVQAADFFIKI